MCPKLGHTALYKIIDGTTFERLKIAEMARNSMAITGTIAQATAEDYIDAHANPSPKITITKVQGHARIIKQLWSKCRLCIKFPKRVKIKIKLLI